MRPIDGDKVIAWLTRPKGFRTANITLGDKFRIAFMAAIDDGRFDLPAKKEDIWSWPDTTERRVIDRDINQLIRFKRENR